MKVLLVPAIRQGMGSGHLRRCLDLARRLGGTLLLEDCRAQSGRGAVELLALLGGLAPPVQERLDPEERWDLVLLDRRQTCLSELEPFAHLPLAGLDEGGEARRFLPYLLDTPVGWSAGHRPNLTSAAVLDLPQRRPGWIFPFRRVLLSFGGEDAADLSGKLLERLLEGKVFAPEQVTVVQGPYFQRTRWPPGVRVLLSPQLKALYPEFDLVFTMFGLTAVEAAAAGVPVILFNPSGYHRRLARAAGLPEIGIGRPKLRRLMRLLADRGRFERLLEPAAAAPAAPPAVAVSAAEEEEAAGGRPLGRGFRGTVQESSERGLGQLSAEALLQALLPAPAAGCPMCGRRLNPAVARLPRRSYFRCRGCGVIYLLSFGLPSRSYDESYFFEEYRRQYGRTYLEDFEAIKGAARARLHILRGLLPQSPSPKLLDVGCAYGPFLQAASEAGLQASGLELCPEAARHVREKLGIPCSCGDFLEAALPEGGYDALALWYVIEHFRDAASALRKANRLLRPGGVLALSTPSAAGISARKSLREFLRESPPDHFTVWSPHGTARILRRFGFRLRRIRITGHHPERFPGSRQLPFAARGFPGAASRLLGLGDTFEAYAVKTGEPA